MDKEHYGVNCPDGMVQVEFVHCNPKDRVSDYGWRPVSKTSVEVYIDGERYCIDIGDYNDGIAERRGLYIVGPFYMQCQMTSVNACSIFKNNKGK